MAAPRRDHGMDLNQLTTPMQFVRVGIDPGVQPTTHQLARNAVERLGTCTCRSGATFGWAQVGMSNTSSGTGLSLGSSSVANTLADGAG